MFQPNSDPIHFTRRNEFMWKLFRTITPFKPSQSFSHWFMILILIFALRVENFNEKVLDIRACVCMGMKVFCVQTDI